MTNRSRAVGRPPGAKARGRQRAPAAANPSFTHNDPIQATGTSNPSAHVRLEQMLSQQSQRMMENSIHLMYMRRDIKTLLAPSRTDVTERGSAGQSFIRYSLATGADCVKMNDSSPQDIVEAFQKTGGIWKHIAAVSHRGHHLNLYPNNLDVLETIQQQQPEIRHILQLSEGCKALPELYRVKVLKLEYDKNSLEKPNQYCAAWSELNGVKIIKAYWGHSQLILSLASSEDALRLYKNKWVFLNGKRGTVKPFDQRSLPIFCYNCFQPGHMKPGCRNDTRCGHCAGPHDAQTCKANSVNCPNCGQGHEAWSLSCKDSNVVAMRNTCTLWHERGPAWAPQAQQVSLSGIGSMGSSEKFFEKAKAAPPPQTKSSFEGTKTGGNDNAQKRKLSLETAIASHQRPTKLALTERVQETSAKHAQETPAEQVQETPALHPSNGPPPVGCFSNGPPSSLSPSNFLLPPDHGPGGSSSTIEKNAGSNQAATRTPPKKVSGEKVTKSSKKSSAPTMADWLAKNK